MVQSKKAESVYLVKGIVTIESLKLKIHMEAYKEKNAWCYSFQKTTVYSPGKKKSRSPLEEFIVHTPESEYVLLTIEEERFLVPVFIAEKVLEKENKSSNAEVILSALKKYRVKEMLVEGPSNETK